VSTIVIPLVAAVLDGADLESAFIDEDDGDEEARETVALVAVSRELHAPVARLEDEGVRVLLLSLSLVRVLLKRLVVADRDELE
jgi:hypothetical protein